MDMDLPNDIAFCRLCLTEGSDYIDLSTNKPIATSCRSNISAMFPDINIDSVQQPVVCNDCFEILRKVFFLKSVVKNTESEIKNFIDKSADGFGTGQERIDLRHLRPSRSSLAMPTPLFNNFEELPLLSFAIHGSEDQARDSCGELSSPDSKSLRDSESSPGLKSHPDSLRCNVCDRLFRIKANFDIHVRTCEGKRVKCNVCSSTLASVSSLKIHMRTHTGEKPFRCEICDEAFKQKPMLTRHRIEVHMSGTKQHQCAQCGKRFALQGRLEIHQRTHVIKKPFQCSKCSKRFSTKGNMVTHMRVHTGERPYKCKVCDARFSQIGTLHTHMKMHERREKLQSEDISVESSIHDPLDLLAC